MKTQRHLEPTVPAARPPGADADEVLRDGAGAAPSPHLTAAIEVVLDELDSLAHRAEREGEAVGVPAVALQLRSGEMIRGIVLEYTAWQRAVVIRTSSDQVVRVSLDNITSVAVNLAAEHSRGRALASGFVRVYC